MEKSQILAALQIENSEVRLIVGEFYRDVFYIIGKETVNCHGTNGIRILDQQKVISAIRQAVNNLSEKLKAPLTSVILCVGGYRYKNEVKAYDHLLADKTVHLQDIKDTIKQAYKSPVGTDYEIINLSCNYYRLNGIVYPKIPENEKGDSLNMEVDFVCGDKMMLYDYVSLVEKVGLKVIDIYQDCYCASKEAALFEQSINNFSVNIHLEASHTVYQLISDGRVVGGFSETCGYDQLVKPIMDKFKISFKDASRLLFRYGALGKESGEDRIINRWIVDGQQQTITYDDIQKCIYQPTRLLIDGFYTYCSNILQRNNVRFMVTGQGAGLVGLSELLSERFGREVICYCPDSLGIREHKWSALVGSFAAYKENQAFSDNIINCVDMNIYKQNLLPKHLKDDDEHLTSRLRKLTDRIFVDESD